MVSTSDIAAGSSASAIAAAVSAAAFDADLLLAVVVPIVASWFGLVGIGVLAERSPGQILRQLGGTILLGGVVGIVAVAIITALGVAGITAALLTLSIAVAPVMAWKTLGSAAPRVLDAALGAIGLQRSAKDHDDDRSA